MLRTDPEPSSVPLEGKASLLFGVVEAVDADVDSRACVPFVFDGTTGPGSLASVAGGGGVEGFGGGGGASVSGTAEDTSGVEIGTGGSVGPDSVTSAGS